MRRCRPGVSIAFVPIHAAVCVQACVCGLTSNSIAVGAAIFSLGRKLIVDKTLRLKRQAGN